MSNLIGGLSPQEYKNFLLPSQTVTGNWSHTHWVSNLNLLNYPTLVVFINRLAYFVLHRFSAYPNNIYLFEKFKSHNFSTMQDLDQVKAAKQITKRFKYCLELNQQEIIKIGEKLNEMKQLLKKQAEAPVTEKETQEIREDKKKGEDSPDLDKDSEDKSAQKGSDELSKQPQEEHKLNKKDPVASDEEVLNDESQEQQGEPVNLSKKEGRVARKAERRKKRNEEEAKKIIEAKKKDDVVVAATGADKKTDSDKKGASKDEPLDDFYSDDLFDDGLFKDGKGQIVIDPAPDLKTDQPVKDKPVSVKEDEDVLEDGLFEEEEVVLEPLPEAVKAIVGKPFPLDDSKSIADLTPDERGKYLNDARKLLIFAHKLLRENKKADDPRFLNYIREMNGAFCRALELAKKDSDTLHSELQKKFTTLPDALENDEVFCSAEQMDWLVSTISSRYPAIYELAFDLPSESIFQNDQLASFARQILLGKNEEVEELSPSCFIRLIETLDKSTPPKDRKGEGNSLLNAGSFIMTQFVGPHRRLEENEADVKGKLQRLAKSFIQNWLEGMGTFLEFGDTVFGDSLNAQPASDWTGFVREEYTKTLMSLTKKQLQEEVLNPVLNCPFLQLIAKTYAQDIDGDEWKDSQFPSSLLEKIFREELRNSHNKPLHQKIMQMIEDAHFKNPDDIAVLAKKVGCSPSLIEPLIRIRIFYIFCCIGQNETASVIQGVKQRAKTMHAPALSEDDETPPIKLDVKASKERTLAFDAKFFDRMQLFVETAFSNPRNLHPIAQGESFLNVSSLNHSKTNQVETSIVDLQDLRFSIHASVPYRDYLTAQVEPQALVGNMSQLETEVKELDIVKKAKAFREAEAENKKINSQRSYWSQFRGTNLIPFDKAPHIKLDEDTDALRQAIPFVNTLVSYLYTYKMLKHNDQLSTQQSEAIDASYRQIQTTLGDVAKVLDSLYSQEDPIFETMSEISTIIRNDVYSLSVAEVDIDEEELKGNDEASGGDEIFEPDLGIDRELQLSRDSGKGQKSSWSQAINWASVNILGRESPDIKFFRWKVERYEDLNRAAQIGVQDYLTRNSLGDASQLANQAKQARAPEWLRQLAPVLQFCQQPLRNDHERLNGDYLETVRKSYNEDFLAQLRIAAHWAKNNSTTPGVEHVNGICHQFYARMSFDKRCREIFDTFIALGKEATKGKKLPNHPQLTADTKYAMINDLYEADQLIKAVPHDANGKLAQMWANDLGSKGDGIPGKADPNMQSNPVHIAFNKKIVIKGTGAVSRIEVKDIAMGSPTIETGNGIATINPEFQGFLRHCKESNLVHLYINDLDYRPRSIVQGDESACCQALHDLAENDDFKDTLHVVTFSQNSWFAQQVGHEITRRVITKKGVIVEQETNARAVKEAVISQLLDKDGTCQGVKNYLPRHLISDDDLRVWMKTEIDRLHQVEFANRADFVSKEQRDKFIQRFHVELRTHVDAMLKTNPGKWGYSIYDPSADDFKEELIAQMFDGTPEETGNCIPADLEKKYDLRKWSVQMTAEIHRLLFGGRAVLTLEERRIFDRLFNRNLARKILIETKANSYNESCNGRLDRGAVSDAEEFAYLAILKNCMNQPDVIAFFKMFAIARALLVRKRTIVEESRDRLIETVKFMIDNQQQLQKLQAKLFPGVDITVDQFGIPDDEEEHGLDNLNI